MKNKILINYLNNKYYLNVNFCKRGIERLAKFIKNEALKEKRKEENFDYKNKLKPERNICDKNKLRLLLNKTHFTTTFEHTERESDSVNYSTNYTIKSLEYKYSIETYFDFLHIRVKHYMLDSIIRNSSDIVRIFNF